MAMGFAALKRTEGLLGAVIVGGVLTAGLVAAVMFTTNSTATTSHAVPPKKKYAVEDFIIKRQGRLKSKTTYTGLAAASGLEVEVNFDESDQKLLLNIKDRKGEPMSRVTIDARVTKVRGAKSPRRIAIRDNGEGNYSSGAMGLGKGAWVLSVTAYDLYNRGDHKLMFHTEQPIFLK